MRKGIVAIACTVVVGPANAELIEVTLGTGEAVERRLTVAPGKFAELCTALKRGSVVAWSFQAEAPTDFNIHYHYFKQVKYPERRTNVRGASGRLRVGMDHDYCWMWTNRSTESLALSVTLKEVTR